MIKFTQGNLLTAEVEALVNTVNTVGVMGKGIALMFKERFPENFRIYENACKGKVFDIGQLLVTEVGQLGGPKWIVNFPTKKHWRHPSKMAWVESGLRELRRFITENHVKSIALPPLGSGNGGLNWNDVRLKIINELEDIQSTEIIVYEPTQEYQNVSKKAGVEKLTVARALISELVRRYSILGIDCSLLEIHKLAYLLERRIEASDQPSPLDLRFQADRYGPFAYRLSHLLNTLDGSYLHCDKRISDARPSDTIRFDDGKSSIVSAYLASPDAKRYRRALQETSDLIDGFESPLGMELLTTVDWLVTRENAVPTTEGIIEGLRKWPGGGPEAAERKLRLFDGRMIGLALKQLI